jgi:hypothetical protein
VDWILDLLNERSITYVTFESDENNPDTARYDAVLEIKEGGTWESKPAKDRRVAEETRQVIS